MKHNAWNTVTLCFRLRCDGRARVKQVSREGDGESSQAKGITCAKTLRQESI